MTAVSEDMTPALALPERLTLQEAVLALGDLRRKLPAAQAGSPVTLDAGALTVFDTSAVAVLLELRRILAEEGKTLAVVNAPKRLRDLIGLYGVSELLPI